MARGGYWAACAPPYEGDDHKAFVDGFLTAREAIASAETSFEQGGGGAIAFSQMEGCQAVLLRKFGKLWPEADAFREGDQIGPMDGYMANDSALYCKGQKVGLRTFELPSRKERKRMRREQMDAALGKPENC